MKEYFWHFTRVQDSQNFTSEKFRENKTLAKISEFTVNEIGLVSLSIGSVSIYLILKDPAKICSRPVHIMKFLNRKSNLGFGSWQTGLETRVRN